jgi:hypothetical protein
MSGSSMALLCRIGLIRCALGCVAAKFVEGYLACAFMVCAIASLEREGWPAPIDGWTNFCPADDVMAIRTKNNCSGELLQRLARAYLPWLSSRARRKSRDECIQVANGAL